MELPRYLVVEGPGAQVPGVGFVRAGDQFTPGDDKYIPSRTFRPLNAEAKAALEKVFAEEKKRVEDSKTDAEPAVKQALEGRLKTLEEQRKKNVELYEVVQPQPRQAPGVSMEELDKLTQPAPAPDEHAREREKAKHRTSDR